MDIETMKAYEWALNQKFGSVAAQYAKKLALHIQSAKSATTKEVAEAIAKIEKIVVFDNEHGYRVNNHHSLHISDIKTALTALQAYQPWVPVSERLPESGKHVLLCCEVRPSGKRYVCDGYYANSKSITSGYSDEWDCEYDEETDEYYLPEGYYEIIKNWDDYSSIVIDDFVTHWKPLPELPIGE